MKNYLLVLSLLCFFSISKAGRESTEKRVFIEKNLLKKVDSACNENPEIPKETAIKCFYATLKYVKKTPQLTMRLAEIIWAFVLKTTLHSPLGELDKENLEAEIEYLDKHVLMPENTNS